MQTSTELRALLDKIDRRAILPIKIQEEPISFRAMCCLSTMFRETPLPPPQS